MKLSQFKPRAIAPISAGLAWNYSSNPSEIHEVGDQHMEELLLAQPDCCCRSVGRWGFFPLFDEGAEIRAATSDL